MTSRSAITFPLLIIVAVAAAAGAMAGGTAVFLAVQDSLASRPTPAANPTALPPTAIPSAAANEIPADVDVEVRTVEINTTVIEVVEGISPAVVTVLNLSGRGQEHGGHP